MMSRELLRMGLVFALLTGMFPGLQAAEEHFTVRFAAELSLSLSCRAMAFSPDGEMVAVSPTNGRLTFVRTRDGQVLREFNFNPFSMGFTRDGKRLFGISEQARRIIDVATGSEETVRSSLPPGFLGMNVIRKNGKIVLASMSEDGPLAKSGKVKVGDEIYGIGQGQTGEIQKIVGASPDGVRDTLRGPAGTYLRLSVIPQGKLTPDIVTLRREFATSRAGKLTFDVPWKPNLDETLVWCRFDGYPTYSDASTGEFVSCFNTVTIQVDEHYGLQALAPDQRRCAFVSRKKGNWELFGIEVFNLETQEAEAIIPFAKEGFGPFDFSPDGKRLYVSTGLRVEVIDISKKRTVQTLSDIRPKPKVPMPKAPSPTSENGVSASQAAAIAAGDHNSFVPEYRVAERIPGLSTLAISRQGVLAIGNEAGAVRLIDPASDGVLKSIEPVSAHKVEQIRFSADGTKLAYFSDATLHLVDISGVRIPGNGDQKSK